MTSAGPARRPAPGRPRAAVAVAIALAAVLALLPPGARGESLAASALLIALLAALTRPERSAGVGRTALAVLLALAVPLAMSAVAPGMAVWPLALAVLALAAGLAAASLPAGARRGVALPATLAALGAGVALHGLYQRLWGLEAAAARVAADHPAAPAMLERLAEGRAFAGFVTPAALGAYLALALPVTAALALERTGRARAWLALAVAVQLGGLVATASGSAVAALGGASIVAAARWPRARRVLAVAVLVAAVAAAAVWALRPGLLDPASPRGPLRLRAANWRLAAEVTTDHPWLGVGPGGFQEAYPAYRRPGDNETRHAHHLPLELTAELGVPAGLMAAAAFFIVFGGPLVARRRPPGWHAGAAVGLGAFALHNLVDFTAFLPGTLWSAALVRGWIAARPPAAGEPAGAPAPRPVPRRSPAWAAVPAGVVAAAVLAAAGGLAREQRVAGRAALLGGRHDAAAARAAGAVALAPWHPDGWLLAAEATAPPRRLGELPAETIGRALELVERAVRAAPVRPYARIARSRLRLAAGDLPGAWADARLAAELYPLRETYGAWRDRVRGGLRPAAAASPAESDR